MGGRPRAVHLPDGVTDPSDGAPGTSTAPGAPPPHHREDTHHVNTTLPALAAQRPPTPYEVALAALDLLGDQWGVEPGPMGVTGRLHNADWTHFTVGVCDAGCMYVRNDENGDSAHLRPKVTAGTAALAQALHDVIDSLF